MGLVLLAGLGVKLGVPYLLSRNLVRRVLRTRLEYAFGRPVDVGSFDVSLFPRPRLAANSITVAEDPRFGEEFFLRADSLTAGFDWAALLRGRLRFARFTFTRPSLNVVVAPDGAWNVESWLESRASAGNAAARGAASPERPRQIVVRGGRINFKRGPDKQPFSLVEVDGTLAPEVGGVWRMEFEARLLRAGVALQEAGTLRFLGRLPEAGALPPARTTENLQAATPPAQFDLAWQRASLSDALRLVTGQDYGVRGSLEGNVSVRGPSATAAKDVASPEAESASPPAESRQWTYRAVLHLIGIHRWDLSLRRDHPAVNLTVEGTVTADRSRWEFKKVSLEAPRSSLRASGVFVREAAEETRFRFLSSSIHFDDLFAWYRAFHAGVADRVALDGYLGVDVQVAGWPPHIERGVLATDGARVVVPGVKGGFAVSSGALRVDPKSVNLSPLTVTLGESSGSIHLSVKSLPGLGSPFQVALVGDTARVEEIFAAAAALGLTRPQGWRAEGTIQARLRWQGSRAPWRVAPSGTVDLEDVNLRADALALPIHHAHAHIEITAAERRVRISAAEFLGAKWNGIVRAKTFAGPWNFLLDADRLDTKEFRRWFPEPASPGLLESALPGDQQAPGRVAWPEEFVANGRLTVGEIAIGRLRLRKLKATAAVANRRMELSPAEAEFYGGRVRGTFRAGFDATPRYDVEAQFERVNLASLVAPHPTLTGCCSGTGQGAIKLTARGDGREALLKSLAGEGSAKVSDGELHNMGLANILAPGSPPTASTRFRTTSGKFVIADSQTRFDDLLLIGPGIEARATGYVRFSGPLVIDFDVYVPAPGETWPDIGLPRHYLRMTGNLAHPQLSTVPQP